MASRGDYVRLVLGVFLNPPSPPARGDPPRVLGLLGSGKYGGLLGRALGRPLPEGLAALPGRSGATPCLANARDP